MQFNELINDVLNENTDKEGAIIPVLDGEPEIYVTMVYGLFDDDRDRWNFYYRAAVRVYEHDTSWSSLRGDVLYCGDDFYVARNAMSKHMSENELPFRSLNFLLQVKRFENLVGEFKSLYFDDGDQPPIYTFACKIDPAQTRLLQINKDLNYTDTSGLDELM